MNATHESESPGWWAKPGGGREVMKLAWPLVLSSLSWTLLTFIDRMYLTWWSRDALAASFPASLLWWTSMCLPLGMCTYAATFVSQYHGAGKPSLIGPYMWQGVWAAILATPLVWLVTLAAPAIFAAAGHEPRVLATEISYFQRLSLGSPAMLIANAMASFYSGRSHTSVVMVVDGLAAVTNIVLDYCWIFGHLGFAAWGVEGAAWATVVALWLKVAIYAALLLSRPHRTAYLTHHLAFQPALFRRLVYFGFPSGLQMFLEVLGFTAFVFLVGRLGVNELAATNLAFNISSLAFMPVYGLAMAGSILVGQNLGRRQPDRAATAVWTTMWIAGAYMSLTSLMFVLFPDLFLFGFFADQNSQSVDRQAIHGVAVVLLRYVAAFNLFDALNLVFANAIKGAGDTHFVFKISFLMAIVLAGGAWLGLNVFGFGLHASWTLVTLWVCALGCLYLARFLHGHWRSLSVIDESHGAPSSTAEPVWHAGPPA